LYSILFYIIVTLENAYSLLDLHQEFRQVKQKYENGLEDVNKAFE